MGRMARTRFDLLHPTVNRRVNEKQADQIAYHDRKARERSFKIGQRVVVRNQIPGRPWVPGIVAEVQGPLTYLVRLDTGQIWKRHIDHVREVGVSNDVQTSTTDTEVSDVLIPTDIIIAQMTLLPCLNLLQKILEVLPCQVQVPMLILH